MHIKIADYGISRQTAPSGSKGFGGTEGFMAPEIIRYNGEEEYTEKVSKIKYLQASCANKTLFRLIVSRLACLFTRILACVSLLKDTNQLKSAYWRAVDRL